MRALSEGARDIAPLPKVVNRARKRRCGKSLAAFCREYFPETFYLPFSADHLRVIAKLEQTVLQGGKSAIAMPRGSGKTALCEKAILWAVLYGYRKFAVLIGSELHIITRSLRSIKTAIETNDRLHEDFPEVTHAIRSLERVSQRAPGQRFEGKPTYILWNDTEIVLPTLPGSKASAATISVAGITGAVRGAKFARPDGKEARPDLVLVDDPQTRESAKSPTQCKDRLAVMESDIGRLAGPGVRIGIMAAVTIIYPDDLSDQILDHDLNPSWHGETTRMMVSMPTHENLWAEYAALRKLDQQADDRTFARSTAFYKAHRKPMDAGAEAAWPELFDEGELSAIQHAMNIRTDCQDESTFWAECQNAPRRPELEGSPVLTAAAICRKLHGLPRGVPPAWSEWITAMIDIGDHVLWFCVAAFSPRFSGAVIDYGTWPAQPSRNISKAKLSATLDRKYPGAGLNGRIVAGLNDLIAYLVGQEYVREDGVAMRVNRIGIDTGHKPDVVHNLVRASMHAGLLLPTLGRGVTSANRPMAEYDGSRGDRVGHFWIHERAKGRAGRKLLIDTNHWKTFVHQRLAVALGDPESLSLYGHVEAEHDTFAQHLTAEAAKRDNTDYGREIWKWYELPNVRDNDWFDCLVGCSAVASFLGAATAGTEPAAKRKRVKWSDVQRRKMQQVRQGG